MGDVVCYNWCRWIVVGGLVFTACEFYACGFCCNDVVVVLCDYCCADVGGYGAQIARCRIYRTVVVCEFGILGILDCGTAFCKCVGNGGFGYWMAGHFVGNCDGGFGLYAIKASK